MDFLDDLTPVQKEAVLCTEGPLLILAGAGSGKTRVLTYRIAYLVKKHQISPYNIMAVTFTNKAAREMKERIAQQLGRSDFPYIGTFHSTCAKILRKHIEYLGYKSNFVIYDTGEQLETLKSVLKKLNLDEKHFVPKRIHAIIMQLKNQMLKGLDDAKAEIRNIYQAYQDELKANQALDFEDLILKVIELFNSFPDILQDYQERIRYILVDEYQDVNYSQYMLIKTLAAARRNLCVVGDDDQSIYAFRGADISIILNFERDFPEAKVVKLEQNFRSNNNILSIANDIIKNNLDRKPKQLWTEKAPGDKLAVMEALDEREEARFVVKEMKRLNQQGKAFGDMVVLYRTNAQSRAFEEVLMQEGIPYKIVGGLRFYDRKEIKDVLAYLNLIYNPADWISFKRVLSSFIPGVGEKSFETLNDYAQSRQSSLLEVLNELEQVPGLSAKIRQHLQDFAGTFQVLYRKKHKTSARKLIESLLQTSGYRKALEQEASVEAIARLENLDELLSVAEEFSRYIGDASLETFLQEVSLIADIDTLKEDSDFVTLMTLHSAKGLEFPVVFMAGLEEGLLPHIHSLYNYKDLEEERRLCYVGVTRAQEKLYFSYANDRIVGGMRLSREASRFIDEISQDLFNILKPYATAPADAPSPKPAALARQAITKQVFAPGTLVVHKLWGQGEVLKQERELLTIKFSIGEKTLHQDFVKAADQDRPGFQSGDKIMHSQFGSGLVWEIIQEAGELKIVAVFPEFGKQKFPLSEVQVNKP